MNTEEFSYKEILEFGSEKLKKSEIAEAELDAWYLLEDVSGLSRADYFLHSNDKIGKGILKAYRKKERENPSFLCAWN